MKVSCEECGVAVPEVWQKEFLSGETNCGVCGAYVAKPTRCNPEAGTHATPHVGCILR